MHPGQKRSPLCEGKAQLRQTALAAFNNDQDSLVLDNIALLVCQRASMIKRMVCSPPLRH
ncbi:hypothetical protein BZM27_52535 [Paraburkholderia steynii]|uniref:Uncharacterized protein n=1 Tax=Paraburkholderia steynii TaxID=1245441 RepID=A0A4R0WYW0_9BURK|nr:hypothetical protein BZM27_52535 [Paraburkholderia steynii]